MGDACSACKGRKTIWDRRTKTDKVCWKCKGRGAPGPLS